MIHRNRIKRITRLLIGLLVCATLVSATSIPALAAKDFPPAAYEPPTGGTGIKGIEDEAGWGYKWNEIISTVLFIAKAACAVCVAFGGFLLVVPAIVGGDAPEKSIEKGKLVIKYAIIALLCLYLLPSVAKVAYSLITSGIVPTWKPPTGAPL